MEKNGRKGMPKIEILKSLGRSQNNTFKKVTSEISFQIDKKYSSKFAESSDIVLAQDILDKNRQCYLIIKSSRNISSINPSQLLDQFLLINLNQMHIEAGPDSINNLIGYIRKFNQNVEFYGLKRAKKTVPLHILEK